MTQKWVPHYQKLNGAHHTNIIDHQSLCTILPMICVLYLFCIGTKKPNVNRESKGKVEKIELKNIFPGLYYWNWQVSDGYAFQVITNSKNYYFTIVVT